MVGRQLPFFSLIVPFWSIAAYAGFRGMLEVWPALLVAGVAFAVPQFLVSNYHGRGWWTSSPSAARWSACALFLRVWRPRDLGRTPASRAHGRDARSAAPLRVAVDAVDRSRRSSSSRGARRR